MLRFVCSVLSRVVAAAGILLLFVGTVEDGAVSAVTAAFLPHPQPPPLLSPQQHRRRRSRSCGAAAAASLGHNCNHINDGRSSGSSQQQRRLQLAAINNDNDSNSNFWTQQQELARELLQTTTTAATASRDDSGDGIAAAASQVVGGGGSQKLTQREKFEQRRLALVGDTAYLAAFAVCALWMASPDPFTALSYGFGAALGCAYAYGLGKSVERIGASIDDNEAVAGAGVGEARFAFLIALFVVVGKFRNDGLEEIPSIAGFFTYQLASLFQGLREIND
jgi:hypothetical protein